MISFISKIYRFAFIFILFFIVFLNTGCSLFGIRTVEEVSYELIEANGNKEIRQYQPRIIAKTKITGDYKSSQKQGFRILADYIFGKNSKQQKVSMTSPVTQEVKSTKIPMTAPVTHEKGNGTWTMTFAMPLEYKKISDLPTPLDKRIILQEHPGGLFAVIRYTWLTSENRNQEKYSELVEWLDKEGKYESIHEPYYAGYDPPWTIPFLRRQEILVEIKSLKNRESN